MGQGNTTQQRSQNAADEPKMNPVERNRYFNGKLMTARDMQAEQEYHRARLHMISKHVLGTGLICGLNVKTVTERDERLYASIEPGLGLDRSGRSVLIDKEQEVIVKDAEAGKKEKRTCPDGDRIYLFLLYDERDVDAIPVPDSRNACEERCCYNRVIEEFEVVYTETRPERYKQVPTVDFPTSDELDAYEGESFPYDPALTKMAQSYYEYNCDLNSVGCDFDRDCSLFLGHFEKRGKRWDYQEFPDFRPIVYTNDMIYSIIARHVTNFNNPHEVEKGLKSVEGVSNPGGNIDFHSLDNTIVIEGNNEKGDKHVNFEASKKVARKNQLESLEDRITELEDCVRTLVTYLRENNDDIELDEACAQLCDDQGTPEQKPQQQERQEKGSDGEIG